MLVSIAAWRWPMAAHAPCQTTARGAACLATELAAARLPRRLLLARHLPEATRTDTHCFTPMLGGRFVRDLHMRRGRAAPYSGETLYRWDPAARRIRFDYYASDGGYERRPADPTPTGIASRKKIMSVPAAGG